MEKSVISGLKHPRSYKGMDLPFKIWMGVLDSRGCSHAKSLKNDKSMHEFNKIVAF